MLNGFKDFFALIVLASLAISTLANAALSEDWNSYSPAYNLGPGDNDWWREYPDQNKDSGMTVEHLSWIEDALEEKPVLILVHSSDCIPCLVQVPRINNALKSYGLNISYYDILAEGKGMQKAMGILDVYNPAGRDEQQYVPTTIFVTLIKGSDGEADVAWHSQTDIMSDDEINSYTKDAIYYYNQNAAGWK
jgi:thiol-disulfide isomerase/thioredoxin